MTFRASAAIRNLSFGPRLQFWSTILVLDALIAVLFLAALQWVGERRLAADFTSYYSAATIVARGLGDNLYDLELQRQVQQELMYPHQFLVGSVLPFEYPPFAVLPVLPFTSLRMDHAYYLWAGLNMVLYSSALLLLSRSIPQTRPANWALLLLWHASLAFVPFFTSLTLGQLSFIILICFSIGFYFLNKGRDTIAGFALAGIVLKPHLLITTLLFLLWKRRWQAVAGLGGGVASLSVLTLWLVGGFNLEQYVQLNATISGWYPASYNLTWFGFFSNVLQRWPTGVVIATITFSALSLLGLAIAWRGNWCPSSESFPMGLSLLLIVSILVAPHLYPHDLLLLVPAAFYAASHMLRTQPSDARLVAAKCFGGLMFITVLADGYPLFPLPVRPMFLMLVITGVAEFAVLRSRIAR